MLFARQRRLLALVDALGGEVCGLDFQKLLFLYCQDVEESPSYEFVPYRFGGFSFTSYADKRRLIEQGMLADEERLWKLTPTGRAAAMVDRPERLRMHQFAKTHSQWRGEALVAEAYRRHPYFATRSEMATRVLAEDGPALTAVEAARPDPPRPGLVTIGYEGRALEGYLNRLLQDGVTLLCDVRRNAFSHKYGFSKNTLAESCGGVGIRYEHVPELGIPSGQRRELKTQSDYDALFARYERESLPKQTAALARIYAWIATGERVALTCFEKLPSQCHRHCVAEALERQYGKEFMAVNL
ncbi:MAG: DUF488 domain-containing protein [Verrucomicrobiales bacterium]|nr:DUF488 domain-containing protein [Verrucomicrobiales bacterium]MCP5524873.1 DUF488 domain-containing protein [Verrucomicrobiales bacterium]